MRLPRPAAALIAVSLSLPLPALAQGLPAEVQQALDRARLPADALSVVVQPVGAATPRLAWRAEVPVNPASLMKLVTTYAALDQLGPAWTWITPVWVQGRIEAGVLDGDLVLQGSGDPKLVLERLWLMLRRVQQFGVREIRGDIVLDRSAFAVPETDPAAFDGEPLRAYNVLPDALLLNYKAVSYSFTPDTARGIAAIGVDPPLAATTVDAAVPLAAGPCDDWRRQLKADFSDPSRPRFAGSFPVGCGEKQWVLAHGAPKAFDERVLTGLWRDMGGLLRGRVREGLAPATKPTFELVSPPLAEVVREINKFSNNVMAQQLFLTLARSQRGSGSPEAARVLVGDWLAQRLGPAAAGTVVDNGSGLSRQGRISAGALAALLQDAWASAVMPEFVASLPVAGVDGTARRARGVAGRAHLKTGSLRDVNAVAGYVLGAGGRRQVLVAIINHPDASAGRPVLEALAQWAAAAGGDGAPAAERGP